MASTIMDNFSYLHYSQTLNKCLLGTDLGTGKKNLNNTGKVPTLQGLPPSWGGGKQENRKKKKKIKKICAAVFTLIILLF